MLSLLPVLTLTQEKLELPPCQTWPKLFSFFTTICTLEITLHFTDEKTEAWRGLTQGHQLVTGRSWSQTHSHLTPSLGSCDEVILLLWAAASF